MADSLSATVGWRLADMLKGGSKTNKPNQSGTATFVRMDSDGTAWIRLPGNDFDTPAQGGVYVDAKEGDTVTYTISGGQVSISGNATSPAVGGTYVAEKVEPVERKASQAKAAADIATYEAGRASDAANSAQSSADDAATAAAQAISDAANAATAASNAQTSADNAATAAGNAQTSANNAAAAAAVADEKAVAAGNAAAAAQRSANSANTYANAALDQLGIVQDVIGVLTWATEHGSFTLTSDTTIVEGKVYFTYDSQTGDYTPVIDPQASALSTYYELSVDEAMEAYIMAHLAVTSRGLWVLPSGIGSGTTPASGESQQDSDARQGSGYKMLLASNGIYLYDSNGVVATNVGENITFSSDRDWYVGSNDAYIFYDASEGVINIGGTGVKFNGTKTLSALLSDVSSAAQAASAAQSTADGANGREQTIYRSAANGTSSMSANTTWVTDATGGQNKWTTVRPEYSQTYPVLFVATQRQTVAQTSGTACTCTTPAIDNTTTVIDGGNIITGSVTASKLDAANINASNSLTIGAMTTATQSAVLNSELSDDISDAAKTATNYIRADATGIRIASTDPSELTTTTYQHQTSAKTEFVVSGATMSDVSGNGLRAYDGLGTAAANILAQFTTSGAQIGKASTEHVTIDTDGMDFCDGGTSLALFGADGARIGSTSGTNITIGSDEASINDASRKVFKAALSGMTITTRSGESTRPAVTFDGPSMGSIGSISIRPSSGFDGDTTYLKWLDGFDIDVDIRDVLLVTRNNVQVIIINSGGLQFTRPVYETDTHTIDGHSLVTTTDSIGSGVTLSEDTGGTGVYFREGNVGADNLGYVRSFGRSGSDKLRGVQIGGRNTFNTNYNFLYLLTDEDGNRVVQMSEVAPWQKALYTHYLPGDTISGSCRAGGYVTNSTKDVRWTIPLSKPISGSISCTSMSMTVRIAGTYIYGTSSGNASVPVANLTCAVTPSGIDCQYRASSAISGATNNSECAIEVSYSFTVS